MLHSYILNTILIPPWFHVVLHDHNLPERIRNADKGRDLLLFLVWIVNGQCGLDVISFIPSVHHKVDLQLLPEIASVILLCVDLNHSYVYVISAPQEVVIENILHQMGFLNLSESKTCIP